MTDVPSEKACTRCGEIKPLDQFHRCKGSPGGRRARCNRAGASAARAMREDLLATA